MNNISDYALVTPYSRLGGRGVPTASSTTYGNISGSQEILGSSLGITPGNISGNDGRQGRDKVFGPPEASPQPYREPNFARRRWFGAEDFEAPSDAVSGARAWCMIVTKKSEFTGHSESINIIILPLLFRH